MDKKSPREAKKRDYVRPRVRTYQVYEQNSLACGKVQGTSQCRATGKVS